jgi:hypothetical protein
MNCSFARSLSLAAALLAAPLAIAQEDGAPPVPAATSDAPAVAIAKPTGAEKVRPLTVTVELLGTTKIVGTLTDSSELQIRTSFGEASIPLAEVAGIRFAGNDDSSTTVIMLNGDSITGATDVKLVTVETEWGIAKVNGPSISSLLFTPGLQWNSVAGLNGKRWSLVDAKSQQPAPVQGGAAPGRPVRSTTGTPIPSGSPAPVINNGPVVISNQ